MGRNTRNDDSREQGITTVEQQQEGEIIEQEKEEKKISVIKQSN